MKTKICSNCKEDKDICYFGEKKTTKDGYQSRCKECRKIESQKRKEKYPNHNQEYHEKNKEKLNKRNRIYYHNNKEYFTDWTNKNRDNINERRRENYKNNVELEREKRKIYKEENKEKILKHQHNYRLKNYEKIKNNRKIYREINKDRINAYYRERRKTDELYKLRVNYRNRIKNYFRKQGMLMNCGTFEIVGLTPEKLKEHLESKFTEGMSWDNYGFYGWHIDHIIPLSSANNSEELHNLCYYTNLQPLWWFDNLSKGDKIM